MEERLNFFFDKEGDILDLSIGKPKKAISEEIDDDILIRIDPISKKIVGFTILNFEKRFKDLKTAEQLPIKAVFDLIKKAA